MAENYSTVDKIVRECLIKIGEDSTHKYEQLLPFAFDFLDEFKYDSAREVKTVELEICHDREVKLPADFVDYVKVGIAVGDRVRILRHNSDIPNLPHCHEEQVRPIYSGITDSEERYPFLNAGCDLYGYGAGGYLHSFRLLRNERRLLMSSEVNVGRLFLEYISSDYGQETPVNPYAKKACEYFILWQYYFMTRKENIFKQYETYYYNEMRKVRARLQPFSKQDLYALIGQTYAAY